MKQYMLTAMAAGLIVLTAAFIVVWFVDGMTTAHMPGLHPEVEVGTCWGMWNEDPNPFEPGRYLVKKVSGLKEGWALVSNHWSDHNRTYNTAEEVSDLWRFYDKVDCDLCGRTP